MPRVVPAWRKYTIMKPSREGGPDEPHLVVEKYMLLSINAREAIKNGRNAEGEQEWFLKEPSGMKAADQIVTVSSKQIPVGSDQRPKRRQSSQAVDKSTDAGAEEEAAGA